MKDANARVNYIADPTGKVRKITDMSLKQINNHLSNTSRRIKWDSKMLILLYERRSQLMGEPIEPRKNQRKIMEWVGVKQFKPENEQRYKQLILLCLSMFDNGSADLPVIEAILRQVMDE
tara:strand:+ start:179 stop:538 length:360 start_codon:yes stop_codon:yes gene_type:complete